MKPAHIVAVPFVWLLLPAYFIYGPVSAFDFTGMPDTLPYNSSVELDVSISNPSLKSNPYYLRGVFHQPDSNQYFGFTLNHLGNWHSQSSDHTQFYQINLDSEGSWSGKLQFKPDYLSPHFKGKGDYLFKLGRYTSGGSGPTWTPTISSVYLDAPDPTPTPTPTPKPTSTPKPSPTPITSPTSSPSTSTPFPPTFPTTSAHTSVSPSNQNSSSLSPLILGASDSDYLNLESQDPLTTSSASINPYPLSKNHFLMFCGSGICFVLLALQSHLKQLLDHLKFF